MADMAYLKAILKDRYGITTPEELYTAIQNMNRLDLGMFRSEPTTERKEHLQCAS